MAEGDGPAVDVDLVPVDLVDLAPGHDHGGERLVDLEDVDVGHGHAGLLQHVRSGGDRTVEVVVGIGADQRLGHDAGPGAQSGLAGALLGHPQHSCGTVGDLRTVSGVVHAFGKHRLESGQALRCRLARALVAGDHVGLARRSLSTHDRSLDRDDLPVETTLGHCHGSLTLRLQAQPVDVGPGDPVLLGDPLGGIELVGHIPRELFGTRLARTVVRIGTEADPAHGLDSAGDTGVDGIGADQVGDEVVGLLGRAALAVDGGRRRLVRHALAEPGGPGDIGCLLAGLGHTTADDLLDAARLDAGLLHHADLRPAEELGCVQPGEPSVALTDRSADCFDDDRLSHDESPLSVLVGVDDVRVTGGGHNGVCPRVGKYRTGSTVQARPGRSELTAGSVQ